MELADTVEHDSLLYGDVEVSACFIDTKTQADAVSCAIGTEFHAPLIAKIMPRLGLCFVITMWMRTSPDTGCNITSRIDFSSF